MISFLVKAVLISLSGVMAPGPMTASALAAAAGDGPGQAGAAGRSRPGRPHAGAWVALGHAVIEMPLIFALIFLIQVADFLNDGRAQIVIAVAGGTFLAWMGVQLVGDLRRAEQAGPPAKARHPFVSGVVLSAGNPFFLVWWASAGLKLATEANQWGALALGLFAAVHWSCDLVWLEILSLATFHGTRVLGPQVRQVILGLCAAVMIFFAGWFLFDAGARIWAFFRP